MLKRFFGGRRRTTATSVSSLTSQKPNGVITIDYDEMRNNIPIVCKRERAMTERDIEARSYYYVELYIYMV